MAALLGLDIDRASAVAAQAAHREVGPNEVCAVANDNAPGQMVVSGHRSAVERAIVIARAQSARSITLPVSAPFHSPLMAPAAGVMQEALSRVTLYPPIVPLVANVSAIATRDLSQIRRGLVEQVTAMVRWRETVLFLRDAGIEEIVEIGAGRVLTGLTRRIDPEISARSVGVPPEVKALIKEL